MIHIPVEFTVTHALPVNPASHAHTYRLTLSLAGPIDPETGFIVDMNMVRKLVQPMIDKLQGTQLNDHPLLKDATPQGALAAKFPTCETLARFFVEKLRIPLNALRPSVTLKCVEVRLVGEQEVAKLEWGYATIEL